jgi:hypothetical protein
MILPPVHGVSQLVAYEPQNRAKPLAALADRMNRIVGLRRRQFFESAIDLTANETGNSRPGWVRPFQAKAMSTRDREFGAARCGPSYPLVHSTCLCVQKTGRIRWQPPRPGFTDASLMALAFIPSRVRLRRSGGAVEHLKTVQRQDRQSRRARVQMQRGYRLSQRCDR